MTPPDATPGEVACEQCQRWARWCGEIQEKANADVQQARAEALEAAARLCEQQWTSNGRMLATTTELAVAIRALGPTAGGKAGRERDEAPDRVCVVPRVRVAE
jgi:hypothetical protein